MAQSTPHINKFVIEGDWYVFISNVRDILWQRAPTIKGVWNKLNLWLVYKAGNVAGKCMR